MTHKDLCHSTFNMIELSPLICNIRPLTSPMVTPDLTPTNPDLSPLGKPFHHPMTSQHASKSSPLPPLHIKIPTLFSPDSVTQTPTTPFYFL